jgi:TniQ protein
VYDIWNLTPRPLPPRSRLYSLQPMGIGTSRVESLTSYVMRLAQAHTVSVRALIQREIYPNLPTSPKDTTFEKLHSLNGMGPCFEQWVNVLGRLTARSDLRSLTLLPWQTLLSSGGVLRRRRAWCRRCFQEWRHSAMPILRVLAVGACAGGGLPDSRSLVGTALSPLPTKHVSPLSTRTSRVLRSLQSLARR